jgi:hypothetical protein
MRNVSDNAVEKIRKSEPLQCGLVAGEGCVFEVLA